jgi:hypothetical protein
MGSVLLREPERLRSGTIPSRHDAEDYAPRARAAGEDSSGAGVDDGGGGYDGSARRCPMARPIWTGSISFGLVNKGKYVMVDPEELEAFEPHR